MQKSIFSKTDQNIKGAQEKQKQQYAKRKGMAEYDFKIGDKVLRRNMQQKTRKGKKMEDRWLGPYIIVEITKTSCLLKNKSGKILKQRINICQLKPYLEKDDTSVNKDANDKKTNSGSHESLNSFKGTEQDISVGSINASVIEVSNSLSEVTSTQSEVTSSLSATIGTQMTTEVITP